jgi:hypothetical protein
MDETPDNTDGNTDELSKHKFAGGHEVLNSRSGQMPAQWKQELIAALTSMVEALPDEPPAEVDRLSEPLHSNNDSSGQTGIPTLEDFHNTLIALEASTLKNVKKTNSALDGVAKGLRTLQRQFEEVINKVENPLPERELQSWIALDYQIHRFFERLHQPPPAAPFGLSRKWEAAWEDLSAGGEILRSSLTQMLGQKGLRRISPAPGTAFDPAYMEAVKVGRSTSGAPTAASPSGMSACVVEVVEPAYYHNDQLLRTARVNVERK